MCPLLQAERNNGRSWLSKAKEEPQEQTERGLASQAQAFLFAWLWGQGRAGLFM